MMHGRGESDSATVAGKPTNKAERSAAEPVEPRAEAEGNASQQSTGRAQSRETVSQALERIRQAARQRKKEKFTALLHHISIELLGEAFFELKEDAAPGVDGLTWRTYEADLDRNLTDLHERVHRGAYRALPSRRVYIAKPDGRQRPLAIAALEDKIVQRATVAVLNAIYEEDFLGFSYGFRPGRGIASHQTGTAAAYASTDSRAGKVAEAGRHRLLQLSRGADKRSDTDAFLFHVTNLWRRTLRRRSQKDGTTWERAARLANDWLPKPQILHPWPDVRFAVRYPRWEPRAEIPLARICAGGAR